MNKHSHCSEPGRFHSPGKTFPLYWQVLRLVFVIFSFYLVADTLYRWNGARYYLTFLEFLPSIALITILWTTVAVFIALLIYSAFCILEYLFILIERKFKIEHILISFCLVTLLGILVFTAKKIWPYVAITQKISVILILSSGILAIFITWLLRNKAERWISIIQDRITLWVWIFGAFYILSFPLVIYQTWLMQTHNKAAKTLTQSNKSNKTRPNVILVTFDAMTARNMSVYGYTRPTTPFINEWSEKANVFTRVYAESSFTRPATESLMTGKRVWTHGTYGLENYYDASKEANIENIAYLLKINGYYNVALMSNYLASPKRMGMANNFHEIPHMTKFFKSDSLIGLFKKTIDHLFSNRIILHDWILKSDFLFYKFLFQLLLRDAPSIGNSTEIIFNSTLEILKKNIPEPFFIWIHLEPSHYPYLPPPPYMGMFDTSSGMRTKRSQDEIKSKIDGKVNYSQEELQPFVNTLHARYDETLRYSDNQFKNFIKSLGEEDSFKEPVIIFSSDHGEMFSPFFVGHGQNLYEPELHIPLIIREPDQIKGQVFNNLIEQIDIPATILDLVEIPLPPWVEGRSLLPLMRSEELISRPSFSMHVLYNPSHGPISKGIIAVWEDEYKLIYYIDKNKPHLYNLKEDPDELNNLFHTEDETGERLLQLIQDNLNAANSIISKKL